jgi:hypothetical protein
LGKSQASCSSSFYTLQVAQIKRYSLVFETVGGTIIQKFTDVYLQLRQSETNGE